MPSLGYATDLAVLTATGSTVEVRPGFRAIRTARNPLFRWGNFLLLDDLPRAVSVLRWRAEHAVQFPGAEFATLGVDVPDQVPLGDEWTTSGFTVEHYPVLTASVTAVRRTVADGAVVRSARTDEDWSGVVAIDRELSRDPADEFERFAAAQTETRRHMVDTGGGEWLVAEVDGRVVSTLGIVPATGGAARYQAVATTAAYRRRGLASLLLGAAADIAAVRFGCDRLVIVAEHSGPAAALYRAIGFTETESQVQLECTDLAAAHRQAVATSAARPE